MVVAGPGNNGGDGFVAARYLSERGYAVRVCFVGERTRLKGDAALAAERWTGPAEEASPAALSDCDLIIDALFGAGLDRDVEGLPRAMIDAMNAEGVPIVAVDLPSGDKRNERRRHGGRGQRDPHRDVLSAQDRPHAVARTAALRHGRGRRHRNCRQCSRDDQPADFRQWSATLERVVSAAGLQGHKYSRGHAVVVSGGPSTTGAARLAARGALRAGAGLVTIASPREALAINAAASLAVMVRPVDGAAELRNFLADKRRNAIVLGPGGGVGAAMREQVLAALASQAAVVLDADALTSFAEEPGQLVSAIGKRPGQDVVLTPHEGEFYRIFSNILKKLNLNSKLEKTRLAADYCGAVVVHKGADTVVAAPGRRAAIADNGPPSLATAGSGDVLAGIVAGLMAQGMQAFEAASAAVWLHGEAAAEFGAGLIAEDLPEMLPPVYRRLLRRPCARLTWCPRFHAVTKACPRVRLWLAWRVPAR